MDDLRQIAENSQASQEVAEMYWLLTKVAKIQPKVILEIGVHLGHSLKAWNEAFEPEVLIGVDNETNQTLEDFLLDGDLRYATFLKADSHDDMTAKLIKDLLTNYKKKAVDFLFIDGDHTLEGVKRDFELYSPFVRKGGIIAFHDAALRTHPLVDVHEFIETLEGVQVFLKGGSGVAIYYV